MDKAYNNITEEKLKELLKDICGDSHSLLGITKVNESIYQIKWDGGVIHTGRRGILQYMESFDEAIKEEIKKYSDESTI